jgi:hypothetical protein
LGATKKSALGAEEIVTVVEADLWESAKAVAVTVTGLALGTVEGAVYVVLTPLLVVAEPNEPQAPAEEQLQVTVLFSGPLTRAPMVAVALTAMVPGGVGCRETEIPGGATGAAEVPPPQPDSVTRKLRKKKTPIVTPSFTL